MPHTAECLLQSSNTVRLLEHLFVNNQASTATLRNLDCLSKTRTSSPLSPLSNPGIIPPLMDIARSLIKNVRTTTLYTLNMKYIHLAILLLYRSQNLGNSHSLMQGCQELDPSWEFLFPNSDSDTVLVQPRCHLPTPLCFHSLHLSNLDA